MQGQAPPDEASNLDVQEPADFEPRFTLLAAAEIQDHLMSVTNDLERLQRLLDDAGEALSTHFYGASGKLQDLAQQVNGGQVLQPGAFVDVLQDIAGAITALQFQDMSTQLIAHTSQRLRACADKLAREAFGSDDEDGEAAVIEAPQRPNPVTQDEVDAGSVELF
ncbi:hypothetical protein HNQ51_003216 [Inhella inkyongensis]|uniref:Chemotaxis protein CheZ n=1 Tax=Inhella inkyongensis TaxID=392593 RepID=A0A840S642_9BURK|nr:hypothetical protein [Inhella inkyongensis]MBB5205885.1 hypothetical protein [Inhella inkyongensis]